MNKIRISAYLEMQDLVYICRRNAKGYFALVSNAENFCEQEKYKNKMREWRRLQVKMMIKKFKIKEYLNGRNICKVN